MAAVSKMKRKRILIMIKINQIRQLTALLRWNELLHGNENADIAIIQAETFRFFDIRAKKLMKIGKYKFLSGLEQHVFEKLLSFTRVVQNSQVDRSLRLVIYLKYAREGISQSALAKTIGLSQSTISRIILQISTDILKFANEIIKWPESREEIWSMERDFFRKGRKIRCYGVLDGKHFRCEHPAHSGSLNRNYKSFFSYNSLFLSDSSNRIFYIQLSALGVNSDAQLYRDGPLQSQLDSTRGLAGIRFLPSSSTAMGAFVLADNGFGLSKDCMQPYRSTHLTSENLAYNKELSAVRVLVENTFGVLNTRFRVFNRPLNMSPQNSRLLIVSLSVVHNLIIGEREIYNDFSENPILIDPYCSAEAQRSALKKYMLNL